MGCFTSKLDDLPAVALCRDRCASLDEAIRLRYALADAHLAYVQSLKGVGHSLHNFIEQVFVDSSGSPSSPKFNLPPRKKKASASSPHHSRSTSSSHLQFHSDSEDQSGSLHHSDNSSPAQYYPGDHIGYMNGDQEGLVPYADIGGGFMHMNYMQNKAMPSVLCEQRPGNTETVHQMGESSPSSAYYSHSYSNPNSNPYPSYEYSNYGGGGGGRYGSSPPPPSPGYGTLIPLPARASSSKPPPPPPSPPKVSAWDFLSIFESSDNYTAYTPSRDSKEVRDEEGIPDLEDEDYRHEVVNELHGDKKLLDNGGEKQQKSEVDDDLDYAIGSSISETRPRAVVENDGVEYEVHTVDQKFYGSEAWPEYDDGGTAFKDQVGYKAIFEVATEIEVLFNGASESGNEIAKMLEVGKLPCQRKNG